jgi:hypothetical protein
MPILLQLLFKILNRKCEFSLRIYGSHNCDYEYYFLRSDAAQFGNFYLITWRHITENIILYECTNFQTFVPCYF